MTTTTANVLSLAQALDSFEHYMRGVTPTQRAAHYTILKEMAECVERASKSIAAEAAELARLSEGDAK